MGNYTVGIFLNALFFNFFFIILSVMEAIWDTGGFVTFLKI